MGRLVEVVHVSLGGEIGSPEWAFPYLDEQHMAYALATLERADALLLGRRTYEGLSAAYPTMDPNPFVDRMNAIPKHVATRTLDDLGWNAVPIEGDLATFVSDFKQRAAGDLVKYGNGALDVPLLDAGLIDELHLLLTPVAVGTGQHLFEPVEGAPRLELLRHERFDSGVMLLVYGPRAG